MLALQTITRPEIVTPTWVRAYSAHFTDREHCRGVIRFPQQLVAPDRVVPQAPPDPEAVAAVRAKPAVLVQGMRDTALLPRYTVPAFQLDYPDAPVVRLPDRSALSEVPTTLHIQAPPEVDPVLSKAGGLPPREPFAIRRLMVSARSGMTCRIPRRRSRRRVESCA